MKIKILLLTAILVLAVSCGGTSGGSGASGSAVSEGVGSAAQSENVKNCKVKFSKSDSIQDTAKKANEARVLCTLTEEEVIGMIGVR